MSVTTIANRYGKALADVVLSKGNYTEVKTEMALFADMFEQCADLKEVFSNPTVSVQQHKKLLEALVARSNPTSTTTNFLQVLLQNYRLQHLPEINEAFSRILNERLNIVTAKVTTASPISQQQQDVLKQQLNKVTGKEVRLSFTTDTNIIGGVVTQIGSQIYDGSIRTHLEQLRLRLSQE